MNDSKRFLLIACEVFFREMCWTVARSPHQVDVRFLPKGLHSLGREPMRDQLQEVIDQIDQTRYEAILMGYGNCNNSLIGLKAREIPLVIPRAHDCITLFLGSRQAYTDYFNAHPGTYFLTSGWLERGDSTDGELAQATLEHRMGFDLSYEQLVEKYGEANAAFLHETLHGYQKQYHQYTFIRMGIETGDQFEREAEAKARDRGWALDKIEGTMELIEHLVDGPWDDEQFLVVPPGGELDASYDESIVKIKAPA